MSKYSKVPLLMLVSEDTMQQIEELAERFGTTPAKFGKRCINRGLYAIAHDLKRGKSSAPPEDELPPKADDLIGMSLAELTEATMKESAGADTDDLADYMPGGDKYQAVMNKTMADQAEARRLSALKDQDPELVPGW